MRDINVISGIPLRYVNLQAEYPVFFRNLRFAAGIGHLHSTLPALVLFSHQKANEQLVLNQMVDRVAWSRCWCSVIRLQPTRIIASWPFLPLLSGGRSCIKWCPFCCYSLCHAVYPHHSKFLWLIFFFSLSRSLILLSSNIVVCKNSIVAYFFCRRLLLSTSSLSLSCSMFAKPPPLLFGGNLKKPSFLRLIVYPLLDFGGSWCPLPWLVTPNPAHAAFASIDLPF